MDIGQTGDFFLKNLGRLNILLGKNGSGKSTLLKNAQSAFLDSDPVKPLTAIYITPERGGTLVFDSNVEQSAVNDPHWVTRSRRVNQQRDFKQQSVAQYRNLETSVLREIEFTKRGDTAYTFQSYIEKINSLLDNIEIIRGNQVFSIVKKDTRAALDPSMISSGESELIALAIECLSFKLKDSEGRPKILILDEPDVHLHPDLQVRLMQFIRDLVKDGTMFAVIASHSTALLGALEDKDDLRVAFMKPGEKEITFSEVDKTYRDVLPIFGAHPLSNIFNEAPVLLVEGEDDERIWQSAIRSSKGEIKVYPCVCGSKSELNKYEKLTTSIIKSVYDDAKAYSLKDRDDSITQPLDDLPLIRLMLQCRAAENLMLTDQVLADLPIGSWAELEKRIDKWLIETSSHKYFDEMKKFKEEGFDRCNFDLKDIRNILIGLTGTSKSWEIAVGQAIAKLQWDVGTDFTLASHDLHIYLGEKIIKDILPKKPTSIS